MSGPIEYYTDRWKCRNRTVDSGKNPVPKFPEICEQVRCPEHQTQRMDQASELIHRCSQGPEGSLKAPKFEHVWGKLGIEASQEENH